MKKNTTTTKKNHGARTKTKMNQVRQMAAKEKLTIGVDPGDLSSRYCILNEAGEVVSEDQVPTTQAGMDSLLEKMPSSRVALEAGTHSPWVSRQIASRGHEVIVANPHKVKLITQSVRKNDRVDAEQLARLARVDPKLLSPIRHRGAGAQANLAVIRARAELMAARTALVNCARGLAKPMGERLKKCDADQVKEGLADGLSEGLQRALRPLLKAVEGISEQIGVYDEKIEEIAKRYPEVSLLTPVYGVGTLIAWSFILTIDDAERFERQPAEGNPSDPGLGQQANGTGGGRARPRA
jgi:transposase